MPTLPDAAGRIRLYTIPDSVAGAPQIYQVPDGLRWRLIGFRTIFDTDANAANRRLIFMVNKHTYAMCYTIAQYTVAANLAPLCQFVSDGRNSTGELANVHVTRLPIPLYLDDHCSIQVDIDNVQVGDQMTFCGLLVEEWLEYSNNP